LKGSGDKDGRRRSGADDDNGNGRPQNGRGTGHDTGDDAFRQVPEDSENEEEGDRIYGRRHGKKGPRGRQHKVKHVEKVEESPGKFK
jgi:hypothetical protein